VGTSAVSLFLLYRFLYLHLGIQEIGIYSLVTSITSISSVADFGFSAGVVKFVAAALGSNDSEKAVSIIQTVTLFLGVSMAILLIVLFPVFKILFDLLLLDNEYVIAIEILPLVLVVAWLSMLVSILKGGVDSCLLLDLRSYSVGLFSLIFIGFVFVFTPRYGLKGVVFAHIIQNLGLLILLWLVLKKHLNELRLFPKKFRFDIIKEMWKFGMVFQADTIINRLFDPIVKSLITRFGGIEVLGFYDMSNRLIHQVRAVMVEAIRVIIPTVAYLPQDEIKRKNRILSMSFQINLFFSILAFGMLGIYIKSISRIWIGEIQIQFILFSLVLLVGWFMNTISVPVFFSNIGSGKLKNNVISNIIISGLSFVFGSILGSLIGGFGVVISVTLALIIGSLYLIISSARVEKLNYQSLFSKKGLLPLLFSSIFFITISNALFNHRTSLFYLVVINTITSMVLLTIAWFSPIRKWVTQILKKENLN